MLNNLTNNSKHYVCLQATNKSINYLFMGENKNSSMQKVLSILDKSGIKVSDFRKAISIESQTWNNWKKRKIPADKLGLIAEALTVFTHKKVSIDMLTEKPTLALTYIPSTENKLSIQSNADWAGLFDLWDESTPLRYDEVALPFFREVELSAGNGSTEVQENHGAKLRFPKETLRQHNVLEEYTACVTVKGNSMEPCLRDGAIVGIDTSTTNIINGEMYAIDHAGHLRVKMLYKMPGDKIRIRSYNHDEWPDEIVNHDEIRVIGWVFWYAVSIKRKQ
jgi:phage repressor protein C with HTH and peptisase S24 domain